MMRILTTFLLIGSSFVSSTTSSPFTRGLDAKSLFGVRGGGLFGGKNEDKAPWVILRRIGFSATSLDSTTIVSRQCVVDLIDMMTRQIGKKVTSVGASLFVFCFWYFRAEAASSSEKKLYPPMTVQEIEDWMEHIPVFAVTDSNGAGVVLKPDDTTSVFYFFLNPLAANATMAQLKSVNQDMDLKVSAFSLGKIWFKLLNSGADTEVKVSHLRIRQLFLEKVHGMIILTIFYQQ